MSEETTQNDAPQPVVAAPTAAQLLTEAPASEKSSLNTILVFIIVILGGLIVANGVTKYFPGFGASAPVGAMVAGARAGCANANRASTCWAK